MQHSGKHMVSPRIFVRLHLFLCFRKKREERNVEKGENEWKEKKSKNGKYGTLFIKKGLLQGIGQLSIRNNFFIFY
jgi:hypothetical protein